MAYEVIMVYHLHMPLYFLGIFAEYLYFVLMVFNLLLPSSERYVFLVGNCIFKVFDTGYFLDVIYLFEVCTDGVHIIYIVYVKLNATFENTIVRFNIQFMNIYIQLLRYNLCNLIEDSYAVYTFNVYIDREV